MDVGKENVINHQKFSAFLAEMLDFSQEGE